MSLPFSSLPLRTSGKPAGVDPGPTNRLEMILGAPRCGDDMRLSPGVPGGAEQQRRAAGLDRQRQKLSEDKARPDGPPLEDTATKVNSGRSSMLSR